MLHDEVAALLQDLEPAVIGAADRNAVIAGRRLDPDIVETGFTGEPAIGHAIQGDTTGHRQVLGPGRFAKPAGAGEQHVFGIVLHPPGQILPVPHRRALFPVAAVLDVGLLEIGGPVRHLQRAVGQPHQALDLVVAAIGREPHQLAAFIPVAENVGRRPAVERAHPRHVVELIAQEAAVRLHENLLQAFERRSLELVIALGFARERRCGVARRDRIP